jgi:PAS domain S-box-containing protein
MDRLKPVPRFEFILLACSMVLVVFSAFSSEKNAVELRRATEEVERLNQLVSSNDRLLSALKDLETGQRGYLLTGDTKYLEPFRQATHDIPGLLKELRSYAVDAGQVNRVNRLAELISDKNAEVEAAILVRDQLGPGQALAMVKTDRGRESMDAIRALSGEISHQARATLLANSTGLAVRQSRASWTAVAVTLALFLFLVLAATAIRHGVNQREKLITELDTARQHWQTTLLSIGDGVVVTDAQGSVTFLNGAASRICGRSEHDTLGRQAETVFPLLRESNRQPLLHPIKQVLKNRTVVNMANHTILLCGDGREIPVDDSAAPILSSGDGSLTGAVMVIRDASERHRVEGAIRKWEHVFQHAGFGMAILSLDGEPVLEQVNAAFAGMHRYSPEELQGSPVAAVAAPDARNAELTGVRNAEHDGHLVMETMHLRKDGSQFPALADISVVRDEAGKILYGTAYYSDITERVNAEEELRKNEARFRTLADSLPQLVWTTLPDGTPDYFNSRWEDEIGANLASTEGQGFHYFLHPEDRERCVAEWNKALIEGEVFQTECRLRGPKCTRWYICRAIPVRSADGRILRWFGSCTDIDEQKQATEALRMSKDELQRSNLDLEQFAFAASHDLQEPLRMVAVYAQLLQEEYGGILEGKGQTYLTFAVDGARRMELLLKGLLAYSRAASPNAEVPAGGVSVCDVVQKAIGNVAVQIEESNATISVSELPRIAVPEVHVLQIFQNLISNAIKYGRPEVAPLVAISAVRQADHWLFSVRDNGIGIDPKYQEQIFRVFRRLHGADYPGTGIGLALCQRLVERSGGRIWVDSIPGSGSTFSFTLPARL